MLKGIRLLSFVAVVLSTQLQTVFAAGPVKSQLGPRKAYEAWFDNTYPSMAPYQTHMWSDGRGRVRTEYTLSGRKFISIMDSNNQVMYSIDETTRMVNKVPLTFDQYSGQRDPNEKWTSLGTKVIDGHPCTGKQYTKDGKSSQVWVGNDTDCTVLMTQGGQTFLRLRSYSPIIPVASLFTVPAGYKINDMSEFMKNVNAANRAGSTGNFDYSSLQKMYGNNPGAANPYGNPGSSSKRDNTSQYSGGED